MITYREFGLHNRIGNYLYQYAFLLNCTKRYNEKFIVPSYFLWPYLKQCPQISDNPPKEDIRFHFRHDGFDPVYVDEFFKENKEKNIEINLNPYCQTERIWEDNISFILESLQFKDEYIQQTRVKYKEFFDKPTIGLSIRLGKDYRDSKDFYILPYEWYIKALEKYFPDFRENYNVVVFSDNIEEAKKIFERYNFKYSEHNNSHVLKYDKEYFHTEKSIDQLILSTFMDNFLIASSTYSWWCAYLSNANKTGKIIHCGKNFAGKYLEIMKNIDYYPPRWEKFEI